MQMSFARICAPGSAVALAAMLGCSPKGKGGDVDPQVADASGGGAPIVGSAGGQTAGGASGTSGRPGGTGGAGGGAPGPPPSHDAAPGGGAAPGSVPDAPSA